MELVWESPAKKKKKKRGLRRMNVLNPRTPKEVNQEEDPQDGTGTVLALIRSSLLLVRAMWVKPPLTKEEVTGGKVKFTAADRKRLRVSVNVARGGVGATHQARTQVQRLFRKKKLALAQKNANG